MMKFLIIILSVSSFTPSARADAPVTGYSSIDGAESLSCPDDVLGVIFGNYIKVVANGFVVIEQNTKKIEIFKYASPTWIHCDLKDMGVNDPGQVNELVKATYPNCRAIPPDSYVHLGDMYTRFSIGEKRPKFLKLLTFNRNPYLEKSVLIA